MRIRPNSLGFTLLLAALAALPPLAIDMGLPAFAALSTSFNASAATGLTLRLFMAGFATAQLVFGPFSDRYGRRPILLMGCGIFALANVVCAIAPSIHALITWRFITGAGAGAAAVSTANADLVHSLGADQVIDYRTEDFSVALRDVDVVLDTIGGEQWVPEQKVFAESWVYDPRTDSWEALPPLPTPRHGLGASTIGNRVFVFGGGTQTGGRAATAIHEVLVLPTESAMQ